MTKRIAKLPSFQIPTIDEIRAFMNLCKPDWPKLFIDYYSQRWLDHYVANGFIVGRVKMKDWKACVRGQWLNLKFKEDKDRLDLELKSWQHKVLMDERRRKSAGLFAVVEGNGPSPQDRFLESLDEIFAAFKVGNATDSQLRNVGDWLRRTNLNGVTAAQMDQIVIEQGNLMDHGKILQARQFFANLLKKSLTVKSYYYSRLPQGGQKKII
jgi:hypothetical protein